MVKLLEGTLKKEQVPIRQIGGTPNPELVPIVEKLIELVDTDEFVQIQVADKKELERTRESIKQQLKVRKLRSSTASESKIVHVKKGGKPTGEQRLRITLFMAAYSAVPNPQEGKKKAKRERSNGTSSANEE